MIKKAGKKIIKYFIIILFIATAFLSQKTYAEFLDEYGTEGGNAPNSGPITFNDLNANWDLLCSQRGVHIPSAYDGSALFPSSQTRPEDGKGPYEEETGNNLVTEGSLIVNGNTLKEGSNEFSTNEITPQSYTSETVASYTAGQTKKCTPMGAYILNFAEEKNNGSYPSDVQRAWWYTGEDEGGMTNATAGDSSIRKQASDYQEFVGEIAKNKDDVNKVNTYKKMKSPGGIEIEFPEIDKEKIQDSFKKENAKVQVKNDGNKQTFLVGPFSIDYIEKGSGQYDFSAISGFEIYTNLSNKPLDKEKWRFVWTQKKDHTNYEYPHTKEEFYIEMDYIEGMNMITGIDIDYKYLIAGGYFQHLKGGYEQNTWTIHPPIERVEKDEDGNIQERKWVYTVSKSTSTVGTSQTLALVNRAARWYETTKISMRAKQGNLEIVKKAVDQNGKELTADEVKEKFGSYQYFDFKVTITHEDGRVEEDVVTVRAGSSLSKNYMWIGEKKAPKYKVEEIPNEKWKVKSVEPGEGTLKDGKTVTVTAVNQIVDEKSNSLKIVKTISSPAEKDEEFKFEVTVTMPDHTKRVDVATLIVEKGKTTSAEWFSPVYTWQGEGDATYEIRELETEASKKYNVVINPSSGVLNGDGSVISVNALNSMEPKRHSNKIKIHKTLSEPASQDKTFQFQLIVTGSDGKEIYNNKEIFITVLKGATKGEQEWVSQEFFWNEGETAPTYEVEEIYKGDYTAIITPKAGSLDDTQSEITVEALNTKGELQNRIEIIKTIDGGVADKEETFKFKVEVTKNNGETETEEAKIVVEAGETTGSWTSDKIHTWNKDETAPTYKVEEIEIPEGYKEVTITPREGSLDGEKAKVTVNAINHKEEHKGFLTIEKEMQDNQTTNETFDFKVTVDGVKNTEDGHMEFLVEGVKPGEKKGPYEFRWVGDKAPTYTVEEINLSEKQAQLVSIEATLDGKPAGQKQGNKITGNLSSEGTANIITKFTNKMEKHKGGIKVVKDIYTTEKISKEDLEKNGTKFEIEVVIEGTFEYKGNTYTNSSKVINKKLPEDGTEDGKWEFTIDNVIWYGKEAPTFTVKEKNLPKGWKTRTISYSDLEKQTTSSEGHSLIDGKTITATIVNELPSVTIIDLTFKMGGVVWIDETLDSKNGDEYYNQPNGVYDKGEALKENAEVTVYRVVQDKQGNEIGRSVAKAYQDADNNELVFPIITKSNGRWDVPRIPVPELTEEEKANDYLVGYDVEFVYDGENYEPTEFLSYKVDKDGTKIKNSGSNKKKAEVYKKAESSEKDKYAKDSMAIECENQAKQIAKVSGKTPIDANGDTTGKITLSSGEEREITYFSDNAGTEYPVISKVNTTDEKGKLYDEFKAKARTSAGNLIFPFDVKGYDGSSLTNKTAEITENGVENKYTFMAVYNYCLNINLGLKPRASMDIGLTKKLADAKVIVNEKMYEYKYSGNYDLTEENTDSLDKNIIVTGETQDITYDLGLYKSDYYYRAAMYRSGEGGMYEKLATFYKTLNKLPEDTQMDIYLTYDIVLKNGSSAYDVVINSLDDYYDNTFTLVKAEEQKYLKTETVGGKETNVNELKTVANASDYAERWQDVKTGIIGSDKDENGKNIVYNKMTADGLEIRLAPNEERTVKMTFKLDKGKDNEHAISNSVKLGQKCNVAEIGSYTTYVAGSDELAGKLDRDSAPGNVNISGNNAKVWYEDDTFAAPRLKVNLQSEGSRNINGLAWEDNSSSSSNTENPGYNQTVGNGIKDNNEEGINGLTTTLVEKIAVGNDEGNQYTEYDFVWPTDEKLDCLNGKTIEEIAGFDSTIQTDENGEYGFHNITAGDYVVRFTYGDKNIESQSYSKAEVYNGQDFKSSKFASSLKEGNQIKADSYLDIENLAKNKNTAVDSEVRRLQVVEKSREITYQNASVMAEYGDKLFEDYYMFADTPKIDMNMEIRDVENGVRNGDYTVNNVNFGLEERPITQLTLDKQIEEIILTTSDGKIIMDAKYDIDYKVEENGEIKANVTLNKDSYGTDNLQSLNRDKATNQGFRYINVDSSILEGTTITIKYKFTVLNTGEVDRTGKLAKMDYKQDGTEMKNAYETLTNNLTSYQKDGNSLKNDTAIGKYVGNIYYYGKNRGEEDEVVTSTVRQLVDYIDNDATFRGALNATSNTSWSNITTSELKEIIKSDIVGQDSEGKARILDTAGVQYETENRNNLVVNVDNADEDASLNNAEFIVELVPEEATEKTSKPYQASMSLTVMKIVGSDMNGLQIDNIAEIIKYNNKVGRRDEFAIPGDLDPGVPYTKNREITGETVSLGMSYSRDTSATEFITLSPPTGSPILTWRLQVMGSVIAGLAIVAGGIVIIKKKMLK